MAPAIEVTSFVDDETPLNGSITAVGGDAGITLGEGSHDYEADARQLLLFNLFE